MIQCSVCQKDMNPDQGILCHKCNYRKREVLERKEYQEASEIQKQEYLIALRLRNVLKL